MLLNVHIADTMTLPEKKNKKIKKHSLVIWVEVQSCHGLVKDTDIPLN